MASGVSDRQSVSPINDEVYQSPGASQDDTVDQLLARYGGLGDQKLREDGEGKDEPSGHRNRSAVVLERPSPSTAQAHTPATASNQPTRLVVTPRHVVSAPASHQSTPAREEDPTRLGVPGLTGDTRSFSWDNMASGASAGAQGLTHSRKKQCLFVSNCVYIEECLIFLGSAFVQ